MANLDREAAWHSMVPIMDQGCLDKTLASQDVVTKPDSLS